MGKCKILIPLIVMTGLCVLPLIAQTNVSDTSTPSWYPKIAINTSNDTMVVWQEDVSGDDRIYFALKKEDGNWSNARAIPGQNGGCTVPDIYRKDQDFLVVWHNHSRNAIELVRYIYSRGEWSGTNTIGSGGSVENARVISTTNNRVAVAWQERTPDKYNVKVRVQNSSGKWLNEVNVSQSGYTSKYCDLYPGPNGKIYVAWQQKTPLGGGDNIKEPQMNIENGQGTWGGAFDVNEINEKCYRPSVAVTSSDTVLCSFFHIARQSFYGSVRSGGWSTGSIHLGNWQEHDKYYSDCASIGDGFIFVFKDGGGYIRYITYETSGQNLSGTPLPGTGDPVTTLEFQPTSWGNSKALGKGTYPAVDWYHWAGAAVAWHEGENPEIKVAFVDVDEGGHGEGEPPVADFTYSPQKGVVPLRVSFDASDSTDPDGTIELYEWRFGDGKVGEGKTVSHTYQQKGNFIVRLKVTDNDGNWDKAYGDIEVLQQVFPPLNQQYSRLTNRSLLTVEYIYQVTWSKNPKNQEYGIDVVKYHIYKRRQGTQKYSFLGEAGTKDLIYYDRTLGTSPVKYQYYVTAVDAEGRESKIPN